MRLPLRHGPPRRDAPLQRCLHLEALVEAARGLPLGPAAHWLAGARNRGRHGNALQWHFGLESHDQVPEPDWEGRIEIKLVSVWRRGDGCLRSDRIKVCDVSVNPSRKLANVLFVFADRLSRVVLGHHFFQLAGPSRARLASAWDADPHFDRPLLMVESRDGPEGMTPSYYLASAWLREEGLLPPGPVDIGYPFDAKWWREVRASHYGRPPLLAFARTEKGGLTPCPRCGGQLRTDLDQVFERGWAPAVHTMPIGEQCALRGHAVLDPRRLPAPVGATDLEQIEGVESRTGQDKIWRLADRVAEPEDHGH